MILPFKSPHIDGIAIKKQFGQHFLRDQTVVDTMLNAVTLDTSSSILEIGCGDGFLTRSILQHLSARVWIFEIDPDWAQYVQAHYADPRLSVFTENILEIQFAERLQTFQPWTLLSNLPYQITFPLLFMLHKNRSLFREGVIMVQEEVAHKLLKTSGRDYGFVSIFFQHYFAWRSLQRIPPTAFLPPPKIHSRLLYFAPQLNTCTILHEDQFWKFVKSCFARPRRTLRNNLSATPHAHRIQELGISETLRAQEMTFEDFLALWHKLHVTG